MSDQNKIRLWVYTAVILSLTLCGCQTAGTQPWAPTLTPEIPPAARVPLPGVTAQLTFVADGDLYFLEAYDPTPHSLIASPAHESMPAWSPDGTYLAYIATESDNEEIIIAHVNGVDSGEARIVWRVNVTHNSAREHAPAWSPDGRYIAFASDRDIEWGLYVGDMLITDVQQDAVLFRSTRITFTSFYDGHPTWSPDGERIAYTSDRGLRWQVFLTNPSGGDQIALPGTESLKSTAYPSWSPDGTRVAFASSINGNWNIYTIGIDGVDPRQLTAHPANDWNPAWSPDGDWIAFTSDRSGNGDIYLVSVDGARELRLTDSPAVEMSPAWRPPTDP